MRRIAIVNKKGGVGKTTTAVNLAAALGEMGKQVLLIDLDGQRNTTEWCLGLATPEPEQDIADALMAGSDVTQLAVSTPIAGVELIPASSDLLDAELKMNKPGAEVRLRKNMESWTRTWDYVIIDCPPDLKKLTASAIIAASDVIITAKPGTMDLSGISKLLDDLQDAKEYLNPDLNVAGILLTQADKRTIPTKQAIQMLSETFPGMLFDTIIRLNMRFLEAHGWGQPIMTYAPNSAGDQDYRALAQELMIRFGEV